MRHKFLKGKACSDSGEGAAPSVSLHYYAVERPAFPSFSFSCLLPATDKRIGDVGVPEIDKLELVFDWREDRLLPWSG